MNTFEKGCWNARRELIMGFEETVESLCNSRLQISEYDVVDIDVFRDGAEIYMKQKLVEAYEFLNETLNELKESISKRMDKIVVD